MARSGLRESLVERFPIRRFLLLLTFASFGLVLTSVWKLHAVRHGSPAVDPSGYDELDDFKRELRELIRNENNEMIQQLLERIQVLPSVVVDGEPRTPQLDFAVATSGRSRENGSTVDLKQDVPAVRELSREFWDRDWDLVIEKDVKVRTYLTRFEATCQSYDSLGNILARRGRHLADRNLPVCPCIPATLKGRQKPDKKWLMSLTWERTAPVADTVRLGGHWKPRDCLPRRRVAVIVPARDREQQLRAFLVHMHPLFQRQLIEYRIFVVEQVWPPIFNKASIMNAAFLEASKLCSFDCVMFHDVDLLAEDDRSIVSCGNLPLHYGAYLDKWEYNIGYARIFGGAVCLTREQFIKSNGYSNAFYGWGGEDDDFDRRVRAAGYEIARPPVQVSRHSVLMHIRDKANPVNPGSSSAWQSKPDFYSREGLNTVDYSTDGIFLEPLYTWIKVRLKVPKSRALIAQSPFSYLRVRGACRPPIPAGVVIEQLPLSFASCRYQCDIQPGCKGYLYYSNIDRHCVLLRDYCPVDMDILDAATHIKVYNESAYRYGMQTGDCHGFDIDELKVTLAECTAACNEKSRCAGFVYGELLSSPCWLKNRTCDTAKPNVLGVRTYTKLTAVL